MQRNAEDKGDEIIPMATLAKGPDYPWGLRLRFEDEQLDKLELDCDCEVGDVIDLRCFARVTSVSKNEINGNQQRCVELQVTDVALENESDEATLGDDE